MDAEYDFGRIIRRSAHEQVEVEQAMPVAQPAQTIAVPAVHPRPTVNIYIQQNNGPIFTDSHVTIH